jgi:hypothetical protein
VVALPLDAPGKKVTLMTESKYPDAPIRLVIPFPPGGSTGYTAKVLADALPAVLGAPVTLDPQPGKFGINAIAELVGRAEGRTLMVGSIITNSMTPVWHRDDIAFDYEREIVPVTRLADFPSVVMVNSAARGADHGRGRLLGDRHHQLAGTVRIAPHIGGHARGAASGSGRGDGIGAVTSRDRQGERRGQHQRVTGHVRRCDQDRDGAMGAAAPADHGLVAGVAGDRYVPLRVMSS